MPQVSHDSNTTTSTGHAFSDSSWLDIHFEVSRKEYEAMLRDAGLQPGWHVLDAGCGGGSFLPLMSELVGPTGKITALDLAPENVETVRQRGVAGHFACEVEVHEGSTTKLPFADRTFDAVWSSNVIQYLTEAEFHQAAAEFYRVLKAGGLLALKDADMTAVQFGPLDPTLLWHYWEDRYKYGGVISCLHTTYLRRWVRQAGFTVNSFKTYSGEDYQPLTEQQIQLYRGFLQFWASEALTAPEISAEEKTIWQQTIANADSPDHILNDPDFYIRRPYFLLQATVPE